MIVTEFYNGQGLGNQLWVYSVLRALAWRRGVSFGVQSPEKFKGADIFDIDYGQPVVGGIGPEGGPPTLLPKNISKYLKESQLYDKKTALDVSPADQILLNISDGTKFDGICQSLKYLSGIENYITDWIRIKPRHPFCAELDVNSCIVHVRGGDFLNTLSFLPASYYLNAMNAVLKVSPKAKFVAVTDDLKYCKKILPHIPIIGSTPQNMFDNYRASHHLGGDASEDFLIMNQAKYLILSSSTYSFWAAYLSKTSPFVVAPKYWFGFSKSDGWWSTAECIVPSWNYLDRFGNLSSGTKCILEKKPADAIPYRPVNHVRSILGRIKRRFTAFYVI